MMDEMAATLARRKAKWKPPGDEPASQAGTAQPQVTHHPPPSTSTSTFCTSL